MLPGKKGDRPPMLDVLQPWIIRMYPMIALSPSGAFVGTSQLKWRLLTEPSKPPGADAQLIRRAVNFMMLEKLIGPEAKNLHQQPQSSPQHPPPPQHSKLPPNPPPKRQLPPPRQSSQHIPTPRVATPTLEPFPPPPPQYQYRAASPLSLPPPTPPWNAVSATSAAATGCAVSTTSSRSIRPGKRNASLQPPTPPASDTFDTQPSNSAQPGLSTKFPPQPTERTPTELKAPTLDDQIELLGLDDSDDEASTGRKFGDNEIKDSALFSAQLLQGEDADRSSILIPQYGLLGSILGTNLQDTRIFLNTNIPTSFFVCGLQGSGKSHTLSTLLENYLIPAPKIGILRKPYSALVLHFGEFNSKEAFRPCEAAFLSIPEPEYYRGTGVRGVTILVSPSNYHNLRASYSQIPGVTVKQLKLRSRDLTIQSMLTLMSIDSSSNPPLYMAHVTKVLRDMAARGGDFDYIDFSSRLSELDLIPGQRRMLDQRLELLESFLDLDAWDGGCFDGMETGQQLTIVDLSCPFVDASAACVLFNICIGLFLSATKADAVGKVLAVDEAHKYMTDTPASKLLTEQLLSIIRQQRHYGTSTIIATQEPTISPRLMDLASATVIHRFNSPEWFNTLRRHLSIVNSGGDEAAKLFERIVTLRTGEALVFAPSALLAIHDKNNDTPEDANDGSVACTLVKGLGLSSSGGVRVKKMNTEFSKMKVRKRITADGGKTVRSMAI